MKLQFHTIYRITALSLFALLLFTASADAMEERCKNLGSVCTCSEPLNTDQFDVTRKGTINPADSSPETKECPGEVGAGDMLYKNGQFSVVEQSGMPNGNQVRYVYRNHATSGISNLFGKAVSDSSVRRMCTRVYVKYSADYEVKNNGVGGSCESNKAASFSWGGSNSEMHWDFAEGYAWRLTIINFDRKPSYNLLKSGDLTFDDCRNEWCRMEMCASGELSTGNNISAEASIVGVSSGKRMDWQRTFIGDANNQGRLHGPWIINMYRQNFCRGSKSISHAMQAQWTSDQGQIIGSACEVEGSCENTAPGVIDSLRATGARLSPYDARRPEGSSNQSLEVPVGGGG